MEALTKLIHPSRSIILRGIKRTGKYRVSGKDENNNEEYPAIDVVDCVPVLVGSAPRRCIKIVNINHVQTSIIQHRNSGKSLRAEDGRLSLGNLQVNDPSFLFSHRVISGFHECGSGQPVILFDFNVKSYSRRYIVGEDTEDEIDLKCLSPIFSDAATLDGSDPRFFIHHWVGQVSLLESLKHRGFFLAVDSRKSRLVLRRKTNNSDHDFHFVIKTIEH